MKIIDDILRREGSVFTDHPADRGGPTKFGITQRSWDGYRRGLGNEAPTSVRDLTAADARAFYWVEFVEPCEWIKSPSLRELVVDCTINHGPTLPIRWLQRATNQTPDGILGPKTRAAANALGDDIYADVLRERFKHYAALVVRDDSLIVFLRGWINRACEFIR